MLYYMLECLLGRLVLMMVVLELEVLELDLQQY